MQKVREMEKIFNYWNLFVNTSLVLDEKQI